MNAGTCKTCPSFLSDDESVRVRFGKPTGGAMCGRYGTVLSRPDIDPEEGMKYTAMHCDAYGEKPTAVPVRIEPKVVTLDEKIITGVHNPPDIVSSCMGCANLVRSDVVRSEFGWAVPICKAKGILVLKPMSEQKNCPWATHGVQTTDLLGIDLRPEFKPGFFVPSEYVVSAVVAQGATDVEPSQYKTDKPIEPEDDAEGIRAWRKVHDPRGSGNIIFLPIFDTSKLSDEDRALVPQTGDVEHPELYMDHAGLLYTFGVESFVLEETLALVGPAGTGKTEFARWAAWLMQLPFRRFSFTNATEVEDLIGKWVFRDGETIFEEGRIPKAWVRRGVLVFDEYNVAEDAIQQVIRPLIDNSKQLVLDQAGGEIRDRNKRCYFLMTFNDAHDPRNMGTKVLADPDADRLTVVRLGMPPESIERHIIKQRCLLDGYDITDETLGQIMAIARDIRAASKMNAFPGTWGIRSQIKVARKTRWYKMPEAYRRASLDLYEEETASIVMKFITTITGETDPFAVEDADTSDYF